MTNWGFENDAEQNQANPTDGPKALREAYEAMKQQNKELSDGLAAIQKDLRDAKLSSTFEALGVPGAAKLYQGDADPAKVAEWVNTMKSTFGGTTPGTPEATPAAQPLMQGEQLQQFQQMTEAGQSGAPLGSIEQAVANVGDANNLQDLLSAMKFHG